MKNQSKESVEKFVVNMIFNIERMYCGVINSKQEVYYEVAKPLILKLSNINDKETFEMVTDDVLKNLLENRSHFGEYFQEVCFNGDFEVAYEVYKEQTSRRKRKIR